MKILFYIIIATLLVSCSSNNSTDNVFVEPETINSIENNNKNSFSLKSDLEKYNGFYTSVEMSGGTISKENLPDEIANYRNGKIKSISIEYLAEIENGFVLTFSIDFNPYRILIISTLNKDYSLIDYIIYTDGTGTDNVKNDTIALTSFSENSITVEIMHPNKYEEPTYSVDGIRKDELFITENLKLIKKQNPT
ncbi:MAG: hypothetical protein K9J13_10205 [Saprospiraceae bacterium]|nr:hypothetical protein [Saprospiraceae bacterium]